MSSSVGVVGAFVLLLGYPIVDGGLWLVVGMKISRLVKVTAVDIEGVFAGVALR
jgi:hypothetical protein